MSKRRYWLMKSKPDVYSISDLEKDRSTFWDGVRNYQARNLMRDEMTVGDGVLYYHSNCKPPGIVGLARVHRKAHPDPTQFDESSRYFDESSDPDDPRWLGVEIEFVEAFGESLPLPTLRKTSALAGMALLQKGQRLSVQPVRASEWRTILKMAGSSGLPD